MFKVNKIFFGFILATAITAVSYLILHGLNVWVSQFAYHRILKEQLVFILALMPILPILQYYNRRKAYRTVQGIIIFAFIFAGYVIYNYFI